MTNLMLDAEDQMTRLAHMLTLLNMAAGELPKGESRAMSQGLEHAREIADDVLSRLQDIRLKSTEGS